MDATRRSLLAAALAAAAGRVLAGGTALVRDGRGTGYFFDPAMLGYDYGPEHPESPARLRAVDAALRSQGLAAQMAPVTPLADPLPHVLAVHTQAHLDGLQRANAAGYHAACVAIAGVLGAVDSVCRAELANAFCAVRPPGHHATNAGKPYGYCYVNHVAVAAHYCRRVHGMARVLVADWDYHHGDGTQALVEGTPGMLYFSTHNRRAFPGTGRKRRAGRAINVHLGPGSGDDDIVRAWEQHLVPAAAALRPEIVLVSAGFDGMAEDPQGRYRLAEDCYARLTRIVMSVAAEHSQGRLVSVLEGGYAPEALARGVAAHVRTLAGEK
jgi:acetoin utilization deacetylase AcuC-like enzyme